MNINDATSIDLAEKITKITGQRITDDMIDAELVSILPNQFDAKTIMDAKLREKVRLLIADRLISEAVSVVDINQLNKLTPENINSLIRLNGLLLNIQDIFDSLINGKKSNYLTLFSFDELRLAAVINKSIKLLPPPKIELYEVDPMPCIEEEGWMSISCFISEHDNGLTSWLKVLYADQLEGWDFQKIEIAQRCYCFLSCMDGEFAHE